MDELLMAAGDRRPASGHRDPVSGRCSRVTTGPARSAASVAHVGGQPSEFPSVDDRLTGAAGT